MATEIERLDFSKPPPGYCIDEQDDGWWWWLADPEDGNVAPFSSEAEAIAAAWTHYKERHDPPGMWAYHTAGGYAFGLAHRGLTGGSKARSATWAWCRLAEGGEASARNAAWRHYWRRLTLSSRLTHEDMDDLWPHCLEWSDEQVSEVERWLAKGGELPAVLRGEA